MSEQRPPWIVGDGKRQGVQASPAKARYPAALSLPRAHPHPNPRLPPPPRPFIAPHGTNNSSLPPAAHKVWHRGSWDDRFRRADYLRRDRGPVVYTVDSALPAEPCAAAPNQVYVRRHTHVHTYTQGMDHGHVTTLTRVRNPGAPGGPSVLSNGESLCGELGHQVAAINKTLACLQAKCESHKQGGGGISSLANGGIPASEDTAALRARVGNSLAEQMNFYQQCMAIWVGLSHENQRRYVHAMYIAMQRWTEWTKEEQSTFLSLFSEAVKG